MTSRHGFARALVRIYPIAWRREYGEELLDILVARPLTVRVAADVLWSGVALRIRAAAPSTVLGLASMLIVLAGFFLPPVRYSAAVTGVLRPTSMTFPTVEVTFMESEVYVALLIACGWWTARRHHYSAKRCGVVAIRMSLIAGAPVILAGVLLAANAIDVSFAGMGGIRPLPIEVITAPLARLPKAWIWGAMGAWLQYQRVRSQKPA